MPARGRWEARESETSCLAACHLLTPSLHSGGTFKECSYEKSSGFRHWQNSDFPMRQAPEFDRSRGPGLIQLQTP